VGDGFVFQGKVTATGIVNGKIADNDGDTFVFKCTKE
jgi:hypothetical protein